MDILEREGLERTPENIELAYRILEEENINELKRKVAEGASREELFMCGDYSITDLESVGLGVSLLTPRKEPQSVGDALEYSVPNEGKWEYAEDILFWDKAERECALICILANAGLKRFLDVLPAESISELKELLKNY